MIGELGNTNPLRPPSAGLPPLVDRVSWLLFWGGNSPMEGGERRDRVRKAPLSKMPHDAGLGLSQILLWWRSLGGETRLDQEPGVQVS